MVSDRVSSIALLSRILDHAFENRDQDRDSLFFFDCVYTRVVFD